MAFSHSDLIGWSVCWAAQPAKLAERRSQWPEVLTWRWLLDPDRVRRFDRAEQLAIASTAVGYAHRRRVQLWARPGVIWSDCKRLAELGDDGALWALYRRLGEALDVFDGEPAAAAELEQPAEFEPIALEPAELEQPAELEPAEPPPTTHHRARKRR